jgi:hypothetical protein
MLNELLTAPSISREGIAEISASQSAGAASESDADEASPSDARQAE